MRTIKSFTIENSKEFKLKLFNWQKEFSTSVWLDSNDYKQKHTNFDLCLAIEEFTSIKTDYEGAFEKLKEYQAYTKDYIFGYITYDVKNDIEKLKSSNIDELYFPDLYFFQPQKIIFVNNKTIEFHYLNMVNDEIESDFETIQKLKVKTKEAKEIHLKISPRISKEEYLKKVSKTIDYIKKGDIYEANFCQEFYCENASINPYEVYSELNRISSPPFATLFKHDNFHIISASPERFIKKEKLKIISQPIKGTAKRSKNKEEDKNNAELLEKDPKERSENIMIVDLVRNDLSKTATKGSVKVEELCQIYSFEQVHQMISTITSTINHSTSPVDVIKECFPMGSMTGAPKVSAMKIMEELETTKRGMYSGSVGYFTPDNDFDFNVIIRSILYNSEKRYLSYSVGGAITSKSNPEKEYQECLLKGKAMYKVLTKDE